MNARVVVTEATFPQVEKEQTAAEENGASFERFACKNAGEVTQAVKGANVALVQFGIMSEEAIAGMAPGSSVIRYGVGFDNLDVAALKKYGVGGAYVPDYCTSEVADHTAAMILTQLRKLVPMNTSVCNGDWKAVEVSAPLKPFEETTIGFLGFGRIARSVADRLVPFGFQFVVCDPFFHADKDNPYNAKKVDFDGMFEQSDCLTLHAPATKETTRVVNEASLRKMKKTAYIVNSARGDLIDEPALAAALNSGEIAGAAVDVFSAEPLPTDSPLRNAANLLMSPHAAWFSDASVDKLQSLVADEVARALTGQPARRPIPGLD